MEGQRRDKGEDKPVADAHREYLDEEFSSEGEEPEQKGKRHGGRRAQDESSANLWRATYAEEELDKLVNYVKDFTTLSGLSDEDWSEQCISVIRDFITNPNAPILVVFFKGNTLTTQLSFPRKPVHEMTYFYRRLNQIFDSRDFADKILFGTVNDNVEASILTLVKDVFYPMSDRITAWSDSVKEDFCSSIERFLCNLTDLRYKMLGLSVIYQPKEGSELTAEDASSDKKLIKRLEQIVVHWTKQIRIALGDQDQSNAGELLSFKDEYDFWIYRYENLSGLRQQLRMPGAHRTMQLLREARSGQVSRMDALGEEMGRAIDEAKSNLQLLSVLERPYAEAQRLGSPLELLPRLPRLMQLCRVIWLNSRYFGEEADQARVARLFELLGNQIIGLCRASISLDQLFVAGKTRRTIELLEDSISLCRHYKRLYDQISRAHNKLTNHEWQLNSDQVFQYVNVFVVRCHNLIEISQAIIDFTRTDERAEAAGPTQFSGSKGAENEASSAQIEVRFRHVQAWLRRVGWKILNVRQSTWYDDMSHFRGELRRLELALMRLMERALAESGNAEEAARALHRFRHLACRESLQKALHDRATRVWRLLDDEVEASRRQLTSERAEYPALGPYYGGRALALRLKAVRLAELQQLLADCSPAPDGTHQCRGLLVSLGARATELQHAWLAELGDHPQGYLEHQLMRRLHPRYGPLQCNIEPRLIRLCEEAAYWLDLRFDLPALVQQINARWFSLHFIYENVLAIVRAYNNILRALSDEEKLLFRALIRQLDNKIKPGLTKLTWNSDYIEDYIKDCNTHTANLQEFVDIYKKCNADILRICCSICDTSMIKLKAHRVYDLGELITDMKYTRERTVAIYNDKFKEIVQYLLVVYEGFQPVIDDCLSQWKLYLERFDKLLQESFKIALKNSLTVFYGVLHGDGTTAPIPIISLKADLIENKINFHPALTDVARMISEVLHSLIYSLKILPRIVEKFHLNGLETKPFWKECIEDNDLDRTQLMLNSEVSYCFTQVQNYLTTWEPFADIWEVNKDIFIQRYEKLKPTVTVFDADIARYTEVANNVQIQETVVSVHFLEMNAERLKAAIVEQCNLWQRKLTESLLRLTESKVHHIYKYMADNGKKTTKEPTDLMSMQAALRLFDRLSAEIPEEEKEFLKIRQQYEILEKYEVPMKLELKRNIRDIDESWASYVESLASWRLVLMEKKEELKQKLIIEDELAKSNITNLLAKFETEAPFTADWNTTGARNWLRSFHKKVNAAKAKMNRLKKDLTIFSISQLESDELIKLLKDLGAIELIWELTEQWDKAWENYKAGNFWSIEMEDMEETANVLFRKLTRLSRELKEKQWTIVDVTRSHVDKFRRTLPLITDLKNPCMRSRHWKRVMKAIGRDFDPNSNEFTLDAIAEMQMHSFAEEIADISNAATMELGIETGLKNIAAIWKEMPVELTPYKDKGVFSLKSVDNIVQVLEEHQVQLSAMKSTKFVEAFAVEVDNWERALSTVGEILEMVLSVQKGYMYLDNIFGAEDIRKQLPRETEEFDRLTMSWREITSRMAAVGYALEATHKPPGLFNILNKLNNKLEAIQRELEQYLETKRHIFPRFYFISNDDLLEILANSKKPELVQPHIKKLFENIKYIKLGTSASGKTVTEGMSSVEGEYVEFLQPVILEGQVEVWLCYIESAMRECLREVLRLCRVSLRKMSAKRDKWVKEWQSQPGITSTQIQWTSDCTRILLQCKYNWLDSKKMKKRTCRGTPRGRTQVPSELVEYVRTLRGLIENI